MFIDDRTQCKIYAVLDCSVISATLRREDLIPEFLDVIRDTPEYPQFKVPVYAMGDKQSDWWESDEAMYLLDELFDVLNAYAPEDYLFGSTDDLSDFGFWRINDYV